MQINFPECSECGGEAPRIVRGHAIAVCPACAAKDAIERILHDMEPCAAFVVELQRAVERRPLWWRHMIDRDRERVVEYLEGCE